MHMICLYFYLYVCIHARVYVCVYQQAPCLSVFCVRYNSAFISSVIAWLSKM